MLSIVTAQLHQINLQAICYIHIYLIAFKQRIAVNSSHKARKNKTKSLELIGIGIL
jgi:hypothetical protein